MLFDFSLASDEPAGPRTVMDGLLRGWAEAHPGDRVTVFGPASLGPRVADLGYTMVEARIGIPPRRILQQQLELPLRRSARPVDVVVTPNLTCSVTGLGAPIVGTLCDVRHLRRPQEFPPSARLFRAAVWGASARRMSAVASISAFSLQEADALGLRLPAVRAVVPLGLDHVRPPPVLGPKSNTVVCVGHRTSKGLDGIPSVWATVQAELGADAPDLVITGVGPDRQPDLARAMGAAGVARGFRMTEFLPVADLHRTIAQARVVLYLSGYEGYGFVPSEATALGTHSFVYDLPPYRERASALSITAVAVGDTAAVARQLVAYLRAEHTGVRADPPPHWADTAVAYRGLVDRVQSGDERTAESPGAVGSLRPVTTGREGPPKADLLCSLYPEIAAGGFSRVDGAVAFYTRVGALIDAAGPGALVVDFGAGRGACLDDPVPYRRRLRLLRGRGARVVGVDIDPAVLGNDAVDEGHVVKVNGRLPFDDGSVDLVVSDFAFEHVTAPGWVGAEIHRVLRPGGWLCVKTPNRWGYIGVAARVVPNHLHVDLLRCLQPAKPTEDTFPTAYLLNTPGQLRLWFPPERFQHVVWAADTEPAYVGHSHVLARLSRIAFAATPPPLRSVLFAFLRKLDPS